MKKKALITGASRGIGKAIALDLARTGFDVVLSARTVTPGEIHEHGTSIHRPDKRPLPGSLQETAEAAEALGARTLSVPMDLIDQPSVQAGGKRIIDEWGGVDLVVHNGRYLGPGLMDVIMDTPLDSFAKFVQAHCVSAVLLTQMLLPRMLRQGHGTIITVTSNAGIDPSPAPAGKGGWGLAYAVGKAAGHQLVPMLHTEFAARGICAYNLLPGFIRTERRGVIGGSDNIDPSKASPPELVGKVVAWLATSRCARVLSGTIVDAHAIAAQLERQENKAGVPNS